ncbi:MAG: helix-turn-helix transcriptional regulator [Patulibacter sp.]
MLVARDLLVLARRSAGLSQAEVARRVGRSRSTVARWELGEMEPPFDGVIDVVAACGLEMPTRLAVADSSYQADITEQRRREPAERLRWFGLGACVETLARLVARAPDAIVIGDIAGVLQGWPLMPPPNTDVAYCGGQRDAELPGARWVSPLTATQGIGDLRRDVRAVDVDGHRILVAGPLDLLRIELSQPGRAVQAGAYEALIAHERRWPDGPPASPSLTADEARRSADAWLSSQAAA